MSQATSVFTSPRPPSPRETGGALVRMALLPLALVAALALAVAFGLAWLTGDAPDRYAGRGAALARSIPSVDALWATNRTAEARFPC